MIGQPDFSKEGDREASKIFDSSRAFVLDEQSVVMNNSEALLWTRLKRENKLN